MSDAAIGIGKMNKVHAFGVVGNRRRRRVITREIGRFKYRETKPSCDLPLPRRNLTSISSIWFPSVMYSHAPGRKRGKDSNWRKLLSQDSFSPDAGIISGGADAAS